MTSRLHRLIWNVSRHASFHGASDVLLGPTQSSKRRRLTPSLKEARLLLVHAFVSVDDSVSESPTVLIKALTRLNMVASWPNHETNTRDATPRPPTNTEPLINDPTAPSAQRTHAQCFNDAHCVHHTVASHAINGSPPHDKQKPTSSTTNSYNLLPALSENAPNIQSFPLTEHESFNLQANGTHTTMSPRPREHNLSNTAYTQHHLRNTSSTSTPHHAQSSPTNIHIINTTRDAEHLQHHTSSTIRARPSLNASPPPYTGHQSDLTQPSQAAALFNSAPTKTLSTANNNTNEQSTAAALIHTGPNGPPQAYDPKPIPQGPIEFVVDSGSTFHTHHRLQDLHNLRPCSQTFTGSNGKPTQCDTIGDLHCYLQRSDGVPISSPRSTTCTASQITITLYYPYDNLSNAAPPSGSVPNPASNYPTARNYHTTGNTPSTFFPPSLSHRLRHPQPLLLSTRPPWIPPTTPGKALTT